MEYDEITVDVLKVLKAVCEETFGECEAEALQMAIDALEKRGHGAVVQRLKGDHMTIKEIRAMTGLSQIKFAEKYSIPKRTYESWEMGERNPPEYVLKMLERIVKEDYETGD